MMGLFIPVACSFDAGQPVACGKEDRELNVGFYGYFAPISYSESEDPSSPGFNMHRGYEADLLTGLEAMEDPRLSFSRRGLARWDDIWLQSASDRYDVVGGGDYHSGIPNQGRPGQGSGGLYIRSRILPSVPAGEGRGR